MRPGQMFRLLAWAAVVATGIAFAVNVYVGGFGRDRRSFFFNGFLLAMALGNVDRLNKRRDRDGGS